MRRTDREVTDRCAIDDVLNRATVCHMAMVDKGEPYLVPLSYGYDGKALYVHCAPAGRKIDTLKQKADVCFNVVIDDTLVTGETACDYGVKARSVTGTGTVVFFADAAEKRRGFDIIMDHYATGEFSYPDSMVERTCVFKIEIKTLTMKAIGYPKP